MVRSGGLENNRRLEFLNSSSFFAAGIVSLTAYFSASSRSRRRLCPLYDVVPSVLIYPVLGSNGTA
jgi:hypothetical protein